MDQNVLARLDALERANRRLRGWLTVATCTSTVVLTLLLTECVATTSAPFVTADSLRVRELVVIDSQGTVRVRVGAHLPDAMVEGHRLPRGEDASGVLLYDDTGRERGGYVTFAPSRNVALTLDTRERQAALFAAGPTEGAAARLWNGADWVEMRADRKGSRVSVGRDNRLVVALPEWSDADGAVGCSELTSEIQDIKPAPATEQVLAACMVQMPEAICRKCLGRPVPRW